MRKRSDVELEAAQAEVTRLQGVLLRYGLEMEEQRKALVSDIDLMRHLLRATSLKPKPGVYFLLDEVGKLLYVGQSDNVLLRMAGHGPKKFHDARMIHVIPLAERDRLERAFIHAFTPPLNVQLQAFNRSMELRAVKRAEQKSLEAKSMIVEAEKEAT